MSTDTLLTDSFPSQPGALIREEWWQALLRIILLTFSFINRKKNSAEVVTRLE